MAEWSNIGWTDHTFNPWIGCTKIGPGCDHCYAEAWARRYYPSAVWGEARRRTSASAWRNPIHLNNRAARAGVRHFVFCASLADVFDHQVPLDWRFDLFRLIEATPHLVWLLLTKRPQNVTKMLAHAGPLPRNVALGCTVVNQEEADRDVPILLSVPGRTLFRFLSIEPMLGPVDLRALDQSSERYIDWVIIGGESGAGHRPMDPDWVRWLRDQCIAAKRPFFFKQWGGARSSSGGRILDGAYWSDRPHVPPVAPPRVLAAQESFL